MRSHRNVASLLLLLGACGGLGLACEANSEGQSSQALSCSVGYDDFAGPFLLNWCVGCHTSALPEGERQGAPPNVNFDTLDGLRAVAPLARIHVVEAQTMPPVGGPSARERELFGQWLDCGMPAHNGGFDPPPPGEKPDLPPLPTGTCAAPRMPLPDAMLPRCQAATLDCIVDCSLENPDYDPDECRDTCLTADATPPELLAGFPVDCAGCTLLQVLACADQKCHEETARFLCCVEGCAGVETCAATRCTGELSAFGLCVAYTAPECVDYVDGPVSSCFAEEAGGAGGAPGGAGGAGGHE